MVSPSQMLIELGRCSAGCFTLSEMIFLMSVHNHLHEPGVTEKLRSLYEKVCWRVKV